VIVTSPTFAQAQAPSIAKMKEDAQKVVKIISCDKSKTNTYCDLVKVSNQIEQAEPNRKADQLYEQMDELASNRPLKKSFCEMLEV
jgi:aspartokinase